MSDMQKILLNIRSLRAWSRDLELDQLEEGLSKLSVIVEERKNEIQAQQQEEIDKQAKLEAIRKQIDEMGLDSSLVIDALANTGGKKAKSKRKPKEPKYTYLDGNEVRYWTGQGRTPTIIQRALDEGKSMDDFLIK